jgi:hypothetical protein
MIMCGESVARQSCNFHNLIRGTERRVGIIPLSIHSDHTSRMREWQQYIFHENAYSSFNWLKVKILSRLLWYYTTCSQDHGTHFANSEIEQSYKPNGCVLTWSHVMHRSMNEVYLSNPPRKKRWELLKRSHSVYHSSDKNGPGSSEVEDVLPDWLPKVESETVHQLDMTRAASQNDVELRSQL